MDKITFNRLVSKLFVTDAPVLIALQQAKKLGSFSFDFEQYSNAKNGEETQYLRFFAHAYNETDVIFTARLIWSTSGIDKTEVNRYRNFINELQK